MDSKRMFIKTKNYERMKKPTRLAKLPEKTREIQSSMKNPTESDCQLQNGFSKSVYETFGFLTPKKLGYPIENHLLEWNKTRNLVPHDLSSLKVGGRRFPTTTSSLKGEEERQRSKSPKGQEKNDITIQIPSNFSDSSSESSKKLLKLPTIPTTKEIPRSKKIGTKEASKLSTNLSLIESRTKGRTSQRGKTAEKHFFEDKNKLDEISSIRLETNLSLPKITIDEVLKSWDIQPRSMRRNRASSNASEKYDPMNFLTLRQADFENNSQQDNFSSCYEEVRGCRYLRIGKKDEEDGLRHRKSCPCNSCEHGEALKESPYLNA